MHDTPVNATTYRTVSRLEERRGAKPAIARYKAQLARVDRRLSIAQARQDDTADNLRQTFAGGPGLLAREEALADLTKSNSTLRLNVILIQLLIITLGSLPVLMKMVMLSVRDSTYERLMTYADSAEYASVVLAESRRAEMTDIESRIAVEEARVRYQLQHGALDDLMRQLVDARKVVADRWIAQWEESILSSAGSQPALVEQVDGGDDLVRLRVAIYKASGGDSALLTTPAGWTIRAEAHTESFALVWPAMATLLDVVALLGDPGPSAVVLIVVRGAAPREFSWAKASALLAASTEQIEFARFDLDRVTLTWSCGRRQLPPEPDGEPMHEVGVGAEVFDEQQLTFLIRGSAVAQVVELATPLLKSAAEVLGYVPTGLSRG